MHEVEHYERRHAVKLVDGSWIWYHIGKEAAGRDEWSPAKAYVYVHCSKEAELRLHYLSGSYSLETLSNLIETESQREKAEIGVIETLRRALRDLRVERFRPDLPSTQV